MKTSLIAIVILQSSFCILPAAPPPELTILRQQYDKIVAERVTAPFEAALSELNIKYGAGLDRVMAEAKAAGKLEDILAIEAEKKRLTAKLPIPATDDEAEPESLKKFRAIYRQQLAGIDGARDKAHADLLTPYTTKLQALEAVLVKNDRVEEAKEVLAYRQGLSTGTPATAAPTVAASPPTPQPSASTPVAAVPKVKGDDRKAAEWVLANWSESRLFVDEKYVKTAGELPKGKFTVTDLSLDQRFYIGTTPLNETELLEHLGGLEGLRSLHLSGFGDLKDEDLAFLATLPNLDELKLGKLACTDAFLAHLSSLKKLRKLDFGELSNLTGTGFAQLVKVPTLEQIIHWKGGMTDAGIEAISKLPGVTTLDCQSSAQVSNACIPSLRAMPHLTVLLLTSTAITPEGISGIVLPKVTKLGVNGLAKLPLSQLSAPFATSFPNVEVFALSYFANTPEDIASLAHFKKLRALANSGTIKDEALTGLLELRDLGSYQVYTAEISPSAWQTLAKLKKLKTVRYGTKIPDADALAAFKKARPDVTIEP